MIIARAKILPLETGGPNVVVLNKKDAEQEGITFQDRVRVFIPGKGDIICIVNFSESVPSGEVWLYKEVWNKIGADDGDKVYVEVIPKPKSSHYISKKVKGYELTREEIYEIIRDIVDNKISEAEMAAFVTACFINGMSLEETFYLTKAIVDTGQKLHLNTYPIADKHCIGGVPGNRTTMVIVPIVAAAGITIPKTSSRAITSPAGTADTMEVLANVTFTAEEMEEIVKKVGGCIVWGGGANIASADDKLIRIRRPLGLDPKGMLLASILAKKHAVGATHVLIDIPVGAKVKTKIDAMELGNSFRSLGRMLGIHIEIYLSDGTKPIGDGVGPVLEARDVLKILQRYPDRPLDLESKAVDMAGKILEMVGKAKKGEGKRLALEILDSGKAWQKMREIIEAQGGDPNVKPEDLEPGEYFYEVRARGSGVLAGINCKVISRVARVAGAPADKGAGVLLKKKVGDSVERGDVLMIIYSHSEKKLDAAIDIVDTEYPFKIV